GCPHGSRNGRATPRLRRAPADPRESGLLRIPRFRASARNHVARRTPRAPTREESAHAVFIPALSEPSRSLALRAIREPTPAGMRAVRRSTAALADLIADY